MEFTTADDNYCKWGDDTTKLALALANDTAVTAALGYVTDAAISEINGTYKCTFQVYATDLYAPSVKVDNLGHQSYKIQWAEWIANAASGKDLVAANMQNDALPATAGDPYLFDPLVASAFTEITETWKYFPGSWGPNTKLEINAFKTMGATAGDSGNKVLTDTDGFAIVLDSQIWALWNSGVEGVSQAYADAVSEFNSDADSYNSDIEDVEAAREEGKGADEDGSADLPDRPCAPASISYPTSDIEFDSTLATAQTKNIQITPNKVTAVTDAQATGFISLFDNNSPSAGSDYSYDKVWARKVYGRFGQAADSEGEFATGFRAYVEATTENSYEQWMMVSALPNADSVSVNKGTNGVTLSF